MKTNDSWAAVGKHYKLMGRDCTCVRTEAHNGTFYELFRCSDGAVIRAIDEDSDKVVSITHWPLFSVAESTIELALLTN